MKSKNFLTLLFNVVLILLETLIFGFCWLKFYGKWTWIPYFGNGNYVIILLYAFLLIAYNTLNRGFKFSEERTRDVLFSNLISLTIIDIIIYLQICLLAHAVEKIIPLFMAYLVQIIILMVWGFISNKIYHYFVKPLNLAYISKSGENIGLEKFNSYKRNYEVTKCFTLDEFNLLDNKYFDAFDGFVIDTTIKMKDKIINKIYDNDKLVFIVPEISDILLASSSVTYVQDMPVIMLNNSNMSYVQKTVKRLMDIVLSTIVLVIASPIMLITAICIKLEDGGPVLYSQNRLTYNNKVFKIYKFRSMIVDAEKNGAQLMSKSDSRITKVGNIIRKLRIDELPQIINILNGDMSIIGPRPERPEIAEEIYKNLPEFKYRLKCKAGLTGYAQVMGKYNTNFDDKLKFDLYYIENYSLRLDFKILVLTIKTVFKKDATEGV